MTDQTPRHAAPLLAAGQAQKEITHNEALLIMDAALHPSLENEGQSDPPASPQQGQMWRIGAAPTGDWSGRSGQLACFTAGGWRFVLPYAGMTAYARDTARFGYHDGSDWQFGGWPVAAVQVAGRQVVGGQQGAIADPGGGATIDAECRAAVAAILAALRAHGLIAA